MDEARRYGRQDLIEAYLATRSNRYEGYLMESSAYNAALRAYHEGMLDGLQRLFEIRLRGQDIGGFDHRALFMLFRSTADSLLAITTPWSGFLEAGLLHRKLEATGDIGVQVMAASDRIWDRAQQSGRDHRAILDGLLVVFLGDRAGRTFSADDLRAAGVDVSLPRSCDYDYD